MYPSVLNTFNRPTASDRLNSPSHSALHNTVSSALGQVEAFIGRDGFMGSYTAGTILYDVRDPLSNGGGHIQSALRGGTGQITYTKGDLLVATSPSVISKLAVSSTFGETLLADPSQAAGMRWGASGAKVAISTTTSSIYNTNTEEVLFSASILGSTLGTNNAIKFKGIFRFDHDTGETFTIRAKYGNNTALSIVVPAPANRVTSTISFVEGLLVGHTSITTQKAFGEFYGTQNGADFKDALTVGYTKTGAMDFGSSSVNSSANQNFIITGQFSSADPTNSVLGQMFVVEKII